MNLLMISGDRSILEGKQGAFWYTLEELAKYFDRIDIITPRSHKAHPAACKPFQNVEFHPSPWGLWRQPQWIRTKGRELIAQYHHAVMTIHEFPPFYNGMGGLKLAQETGVPAVQEVHHVVGYPQASNISEWIGYWMSRWHLPRSWRCAAAVRCVSGSVRDLLKTWGVERISLMPSMYLDHQALTPDVSIDKKYDIACCARLAPNKGIDRVIDAMKLLPDKTLLIIGDGPERVSLEARAEHAGVAARVTFAGWMNTNTDTYRALQSARIAVMASLSEGGPRSAIEAMALGLPLVATNVGLMPDIIEHGKNGLFTTGEPDDLAIKIGMLLQSEQLRQSIGQAATAVREQFERTALIRAYADFLKSVART